MTEKVFLRLIMDGSIDGVFADFYSAECSIKWASGKMQGWKHTQMTINPFPWAIRTFKLEHPKNRTYFIIEAEVSKVAAPPHIPLE